MEASANTATLQVFRDSEPPKDTAAFTPTLSHGCRNKKSVFVCGTKAVFKEVFPREVAELNLMSSIMVCVV